MSKPQTAWALVTGRGYVSPRTMRSTRREVIDIMLEEWEGVRRQHKYDHLTEAEFWRKMKRKYGWSVKRIELRVLE